MPLKSTEIDTLAETGLNSILQFWDKIIKKNITFGDLSMVLTRMAYLLTAKTINKKTNKIVELN